MIANALIGTDESNSYSQEPIISEEPVAAEKPVVIPEPVVEEEPEQAPAEPEHVVTDPPVKVEQSAPEPAPVVDEPVTELEPVEEGAVSAEEDPEPEEDNIAEVYENSGEGDHVKAPVDLEPEAILEPTAASKKAEDDDSDKKGPRPEPKQNLPETPDLVIAVDIASLKSADSLRLRDFVKKVVVRLNHDFKIGGCLDELRVGIFEHDSSHVNIIVRGSQYNRFLGDRKSCMEEDKDSDFIANDILAHFDENWISVPQESHDHLSERAGNDDNETEETQATHMFLHSKTMLDSWKNERKGQVWRRLNRWNFSPRKIVVFVHDAEESAEFYQGLGIQGKELGYEMIPVSISDDMDGKNKLHEMAKKTQRTGPLPVVTLDIGMEEAPRVISQYLSSTAASKPYTAPLPSE
ncbi:unnamed protein product [Oikopleura dioica]|uniref:Uncharacterized protein n=1 Tax=Oikopleura dioica TaxID=34765 RepID=E4WSG0_OIKDI|nr:unnamed protein product [Oikopleura dioica]